MSPRPKHTSRSRRRSRRAEEREAVVISTDTPITDEQIERLTLIAAATGSTSLPLSDRNAAWDAGAAEKSLDPADFPNAYFWVDPKGDAKTKAAYKLPFASKAGGSLTAVWKGVTAAAGAVQGARGGVSIPSGDVAGVKAKIGAYYTKAAKKYGDDSIKPPWASSAADAVEVLTLHGYEADDVDEFAAALAEDPVDIAAIMLAHAESDGDFDVFNERWDHWSEELGGKPSPGTSKDKRLKENKTKPVVYETEREALDAVRAAFDMGECDECGHAYAMHDGTDGACMMDGCDCAGYVPAEGPDESSIQSGGAVVPVEILHQIETEFGVDGATLGKIVSRLAMSDVMLVADGEPVVKEELPAPNGAQPVVTPAPAGPHGEMRWTANMVPEATLTDDGRAMAPGSISWRELPLTLMAMVETSEGGHVGAEVAGRIDDIHRDGNMIKGSGVFAQTEYGSLIAALSVGAPVDPELLARVQNVLLVDSEGTLVASLVADQTLRGISVDLAIHQYEVGPRSDYFDEDGNWLTEKPAPAEGEEPGEEPSLIDLLFGQDADTIFVVTEAVIGAVTVCPFQAFADANIALAADGAPAKWTVSQQHAMTVTSTPLFDGVIEGELVPVETLTASAAGLAPEAPPAEWFDAPEFEELTAFTVTEDGRIFGHAAAWDTCHIGIPDVCTTAPQTETNYAYFLLKEVLCDDGARVPCGTITLETGHADRSLGRGDAAAHYDNTGLAVADVNVGEDEYGIWVVGALRSDVDADRARELRGAVLSGDWRSVNGNLELVALLAVNVPGFPVPRARALVASGEDGEAEVIALVAAGITIGQIEAHDEIGLKLFSPVQQEKIKAFEAVAAGRFKTLAARALAREGVITKEQIREAAGFAAEPEAPAEADEPEPTVE